MRHIAIGGAILFALALLLAGYPALANPPPPGWLGSFPYATIICDKPDQIVAIFDAHAADPEHGIMAKLAELRAAYPDLKQPPCGSSMVTNVAVGESIDLGDWASGGPHAWAVHFSTSSGTWWMLYLGTLKPKSEPGEGA